MPRLVGEIVAFGGTSTPSGWLLCDGSAVDIVSYRLLYQVIGTQYGGDGTATFAVPAMNGLYIICVDGDVPRYDFGSETTASGRMDSIASTYIPDQEAFFGSMAVGNGLRSLVNDVGIPASGLYNTSVGLGALYSARETYGNTATGYRSLYLAAGPLTYDNTATGATTLESLTVGIDNVGSGVHCLLALTTGNDNAAYGTSSLQYLGVGDGNVAVGDQAGRFYGGAGSDLQLTLANRSTYIGFLARAFANNPENETVIGSYANGLGSNTVAIGSTAVTKTVLRGRLGVNVTSPASWLDVSGDVATALVETNPMLSLIRPTQSSINYPQIATFAVGKYTNVNTESSYDSKTRLDLSLKNANNSTLSADVTVMSWQSDGRIGMGTTAPVADRKSVV